MAQFFFEFFERLIPILELDVNKPHPILCIYLLQIAEYQHDAVICFQVLIDLINKLRQKKVAKM